MTSSRGDKHYKMAAFHVFGNAYDMENLFYHVSRWNGGKNTHQRAIEEYFLEIGSL